MLRRQFAIRCAPWRSPMVFRPKRNARRLTSHETKRAHRRGSPRAGGCCSMARPWRLAWPRLQDRRGRALARRGWSARAYPGWSRARSRRRPADHRRRSHLERLVPGFRADLGVEDLRGRNSGLKYNVSEELSTTFDPPHAAKGWEYQMLDDSLERRTTSLPSHRAGALYDMFAPNAPSA